MTAANTVDDATVSRRLTLGIVLVLAVITSIPMLGFVVVPILYVGAFLKEAMTARKLHLLLPFVLVAGIIHEAAPFAVLYATMPMTGASIAAASATFFVIAIVNWVLYERIVRI